MLPSQNKKNSTITDRSDPSHKNVYDTSLFKKAQINVSKLIRGFSAGSYRSLFKSQGIEYAESKLYSYGDDTRYIDWNLSGRMNALHTKYFLEERNRTVWLMFDCSGSMNIGAPSSIYDIAVETAITFMSLALSQKDKVGAAIFDSSVQYYISPTSLYQSLQRLYFHLEENRFSHNVANLDNVVKFSKKLLLHRSLIIVISDFMIDNCFDALSNLATSHDVLAIRVSYNIRDNFPNGISLNASDAESGGNMLFLSDTIKKQYIENKAQLQRIWKSFNFRRGSGYIDITTQDSVFYKIAKFFRGKNNS